MKRWEEFWRYESSAKKPPPEHGIKVKKPGVTWWGQRWIEALEKVLQGDAGRLSRGRTYARAGRTHDFLVQGGKVTANVTGSRPSPYQVTIELQQFPDGVWQQAIAEMAAKAQFSAELLAGQMPTQIDEAFRAAKRSLFPTHREELSTDCTCPDWGDPCKHVAATHYVLGDAFDRDPFLLFELRGRSKEQVLEALRAARGSAPSSKSTRAKREERPDDAEKLAAAEIPNVTFGKISAADYEKPRAALPTLKFSFDAPVTHGAVLKQLGAPAAWTNAASPQEALAPLVTAAAETARRIALSDPDARADQPELAPEPAQQKLKSSVRSSTQEATRSSKPHTAKSHAAKSHATQSRSSTQRATQFSKSAAKKSRTASREAAKRSR